MSAEKEWILDWFKRRKGIKEEIDDEELNYFEAGWIDSLGIIELITEIEDCFKIRFSPKDFQDRRFSTIGGLAQIIKEKKDGKE
jgi:D-alanine--poly(phosphoribitol) ligase subunit 2